MLLVVDSAGVPSIAAAAASIIPAPSDSANVLLVRIHRDRYLPSTGKGGIRVFSLARTK